MLIISLLNSKTIKEVHIISVVPAYSHCFEIARQNCYRTKNFLIINVFLDITNKDDLVEDDPMIYLNAHTDTYLTDICAKGFSNSLFLYAKETAIYLNVKPSSNGYYIINCTLPFEGL